jgi:ABC-type nickel/cobalt efflux system permease component RcnA
MKRYFLAFALLTLGFGLWTLDSALAHPVPKKCHDRVAVVRLTPEAVTVEYHLEVDEWTVVFEDVPAVLKDEDLAKLKSPAEFYKTFSENYAPILAGNLRATLDKQELPFSCVQHSYKVADSIQCDFVFRAPWKLSTAHGHDFTFHDNNYLLETNGRINLSLARDRALEIFSKTEPSESLKRRALIDLRPGDDAKLRKASATFRYYPGSAAEELSAEPEALPMPKEEAAAARRSLLDTVLDSESGLLMLLLGSMVLGALHALTPGHGKTLVAAYLVGERGTPWHAALLGVVTTLTHTGAVLLLAAAVYFFSKGPAPLGEIQTVLGFIGGLMATGLGFWLLLRRLANQPDHVHLGSHGHHHHHHHDHPHRPDHDHEHSADHYHDEHGHVHALPMNPEPVGLWGLIVLGISGGIVPCMEAIFIFIWVSSRRPLLALPALLAFSAGLAAVLVTIGLLVVYAKGFAASRLGGNRAFRMLPIFSAVVVTFLGLWLCYDSIHSGSH